MKLPVGYLLSACLAALSLTGCNREATQQTPALSQQKGGFDEKVALNEADLLLTTAAKQTGVSTASVKNARTAARFTPEDNVFFSSALAINFNAPQPTVTLTNPAGEPAENVGDPFTGPNEESTFIVAGPPDADNGTATVRVTWTDPANDWDVFILDDQGSLVAQAATYGENFEEATLIDPLPGTYRVVTVNYDQADDDAPFDDWSGSVAFTVPHFGQFLRNQR